MDTSSSKLFQPIKIGPTKPSHRIVMAPLTRLRASISHVQPDFAATYYAQRADVPGTFQIAESTLISPRFGGVRNMPGMYNGAQVTAWRRVTDAVHERRGAVFCQLNAPGRAADPVVLREETGKDDAFVSSSAVAMPSAGAGAGGGGDGEEEGKNPVPRALTEEEVRDCVADFAAAARTAVEAGFDGVEIHGANGYLIDQFLQDTCNVREDRYGGSVENRSRFAVEVAAAVAEAIGAERVGFRISPWSTFQGMQMEGDKPVEQFSHLIRELKKLGLGYLHVIESRVTNWEDKEKEEGIEFALDAWRGSGSPVLVAGGFDAEKAKRAVDEEYKDDEVAVVFGRPFLANPDLPYRIKNGLSMNKYDRNTFYTPESEVGYTDYECSPGFTAGVAL